MLVLSRKPGEALQIGDGVTVTVLAIGGGRVKIGVLAPAEVEVWRAELKGRDARSHPTADAAIDALTSPTPRVQQRAIAIGAKENRHESEAHPA
jgi:carbon storage regulator